MSRTTEGVQWDAGPLPAGPGTAGARTRVVLGIEDVGFHQEVLDWLDRDHRVDVVAAAGDPGRLISFLAPEQADVVLFCPAMARQLSHPSTKAGRPRTLLVAQEMTVPVLRDAIENGASGVFAWPEEREELSQEIARARGARETTTGRRGKILAILGARGGAGSTFIATHLAGIFAQIGLRSVLVDLETVIGDLTVALGVSPEERPRTIADLLPVEHEVSGQHVLDVLYQHPAGFAALLAPLADQASTPIPRALFDACLDHLTTEFQVVLLHLPRGNGDLVARALELADQVMLVMTLDLFSLAGARRTLTGLGLDQAGSRLLIVVNRLGRSEFGLQDVERAMGVRPRATVRFDARVKRAQDRGRLVGLRSRRAISDLRKLVGALQADWNEVDRGERR